MEMMWEGYRLGGRYEIQEKLGEGGMSAVYRAFDHNLKRVVAVKIVHPHLASEPDFVHRFEVEARAVAQLRHPNIVQVYDFAHEGELYYMVLEYIPGETLQQILGDLRQAGQRLPWRESVRLIARLADAVAYAHQQGVIHRDIKPANIMLTPEGEPVLMDFGLARMMQGSHHTRTGTVLGTVLYMAPEQVRGEHVDERVDIYALGAVLFELLTGHPPFQGNNLAEVMQQHLEAPVPDPREEAPELPAALGDIVKRALAKQPADRFPTAEAFETALEAVLAAEEQGKGSGAPATSAPPMGATVVEPSPQALTQEGSLPIGETLHEASPPRGKTVVEPESSLPLPQPAAQAPRAGLQSDGSGAAKGEAPNVASLVQKAVRIRQQGSLYHLAALEAGLLGGLFLYLAYLWLQPAFLWVGFAWWLLAVGVLLRYLPAWWRLSRMYRLTLVQPREAGKASDPSPLKGGLLARFRVPRLDFPHDVELMAFPAALSAVITVGLAFVAMLTPQSLLPLAQGWLALAVISLWFHLRFMALNFLQPGVLDRLHFGHFLLSFSFGLTALPGMALAPYLPAGWQEGVLVVALGAFGVGGMLGALTLIFLLRRALSIGLPQPALAPMVFFSAPLTAIYTLFTLLLFVYLSAEGLPIPAVVFVSTTLMGWGILLSGEVLAGMVYTGYRQAGIPHTPLRWALVDAFVGPGYLALGAWEAGLHRPLIAWVGAASALLGGLLFLGVAWGLQKYGGRSGLTTG